MRIALLCSTRRGYRFLETLRALQPDADLVVFSFREEPWEPAFLDDIQKFCDSKGVALHEARQVGAERWKEFWDSTEVDLMIAVNWRYMIPGSIYQRMRLGAFVFHDSLLPEYRGFSPTVWAILNGEDHTGVTLFEISEEVDSGDIVDQKRIPILPEETIRDVMEKVTDAYLELLRDHLHGLVQGTARRRPQDQSRATYTCKRLPEDNWIDWNSSSRKIFDLIRAVSAPYSGAYTYLNGKKLTVWSARILESRSYAGRIPGRVVEVREGEGACVLTQDGLLLLTEVQLEGSAPCCASEILKSPGQTLRKERE